MQRLVMNSILTGRLFTPKVPAGIKLVKWRPGLAVQFGRAAVQSFDGSPDSAVIPQLKDEHTFADSMRLSDRLGRLIGDATILAVDHTDTSPEVAGLIYCTSGRVTPPRIVTLGVVPAWRLKSLGLCLLESALGALVEQGHGLVDLEVTAANVPAIRLYESAGFSIVNG